MSDEPKQSFLISKARPATLYSTFFVCHVCALLCFIRTRGRPGRPHHLWMLGYYDGTRVGNAGLLSPPSPHLDGVESGTLILNSLTGQEVIWGFTIVGVAAPRPQAGYGSQASPSSF